MSPDTHDEIEVTEAETPPPRPRSGRTMASFEQWENGGKGPSGPTIVTIAFSAGVIALGVLLAMNGVLSPHTLTELNEPVVKRGWAPFFDVSAVGATTAEGAEAETTNAQPRTAASPAAAPEAEPQHDEPMPAAPAEPRASTPSAARVPASQAQEQSDPYSHLEEAAPAPTAPTAPASPQVQSAPRIIGEKNTSVTEAPSPASASAGSKGKSTWGGERTPAEGR